MIAGRNPQIRDTEIKLEMRHFGGGVMDDNTSDRLDSNRFISENTSWPVNLFIPNNSSEFSPLIYRWTGWGFGERDTAVPLLAVIGENRTPYCILYHHYILKTKPLEIPYVFIFLVCEIVFSVLDVSNLSVTCSLR